MTLDEFERLARVITEPLVLVAVTGELLAVNPAATALSTALVPGRPFEDALADERTAAALLRVWSQHGDPVPARFRVRGDVEPVELRAQVARVQLAGRAAVLINAHRDPTAPFAQLNDQLRHLEREVRYRIAAERERAAALAAEQAAHARLVHIQRLSGALAAALDTDEVVEAILAHAAAAADVDGAVVALRRGEVLEIVGDERAGAGGPDDGALALDSSHLLARAARRPAPGFVDAADGSGGTADDEAQHRGGLALVGALPLMATERAAALGALGLLCGPGRQLLPDERAVAELVALLCAQTLDRARLFDRERRFAETLQVALLPEHLPDLDNLDVAVAYLPASEHAVVGGDWYDVIPLAGERVGLIVGDVAGHGPAAATAMAQLRNALRAFATHIADPGDALGAFSDYMCKQLPEHMATVVYVVVDQAAGRLQYANAGHPPPLLRRDRGPAYLQDVLGPPAGVLPGYGYATATVPLDGRARLVCYTDGLIERRGEPIDAGLRRLEGVAADGAGNADTCCSAVLKVLIGEAELDDDAVALVADVHPTGGRDASSWHEELASSP